LWTRYLENGMTDFDQTSPVDLYGQCLGWVRSRANSAHTNELCWHLIGRYCKRDISRTAWRISTRLHQWTCVDSVSDEFDRVQIMRILMSCADIWLVDTVNVISRERLDGFDREQIMRNMFGEMHSKMHLAHTTCVLHTLAPKSYRGEACCDFSCLLSFAINLCTSASVSRFKYACMKYV
jgi:hypothetical protein